MYMEVKTIKAMDPERPNVAQYVEFEPEQSNDTTGTVASARDPYTIK